MPPHTSVRSRYGPLFPLIALALTLAPRPDVSAQGRATIYGRVSDTLDRPLEAVQITLLETGRRTHSLTDGSYRFDSVPDGPHRVLYRRLGYRQLEVSLVLTPGDSLDLSPRLAALPALLDPVVVEARRRTGISGVVGDVAYNPIAGATVELLGTTRRAQTDSTGRFAFTDIPAGTYLLLVRNRRHWPQRRSVSLPAGEEREMSVLLVPLSSTLSSGRMRRLSGFAPIDEAATMEFTSRRVLCRTTRTGPGILVPREELATTGTPTLEHALAQTASAAAAGYGPSELNRYMLFVDGQPYPNWPLSAVRTAEVEAVEIYPAGGFSRVPLRGPTLGNSLPDPFLILYQQCPSGSVWVWTQR